MRKLLLSKGSGVVSSADRSNSNTPGSLTRALTRCGGGMDISSSEALARFSGFIGWFTPPACELHLIRESTRTELRFLASIVDPKSRTIGWIERWVNPKTHTVQHEHLQIKPNFQKNGRGRAILVEAVTLYEQLQIRHIILSAGLDVGVTLWPDAGFQFASPTDVDRINDILAIGWEIENAFERTATPTEVKSFRPHLDHISISTMDELGLIDQDVFERIEEDAVLDLDELRPVGEALLIAISPWEGIIDLHDEIQRRTFLAFLGLDPAKRLQVPSR